MFMDWIRENANGTLFYDSEFVCDNGDEIDFAKKCDGNQDCDGSDEKSCSKIYQIFKKILKIPHYFLFL